MSTPFISRAVFGVLFLSAALSNPAQARPSDPGWHPVLMMPTSSAQEAISTPQRWYGPRGTIAWPSVHDPLLATPTTPIRPARWIGPRGTIPTSK
jgi:hypothetical protein